ncbi:P-loop NTPase fold protein [Acinetobacter dispersus]|uniref:P-loop NTPase fold protein n=1 Tax=Acinetobacter dispersus TaxID=70348 RepID=UPI003C2B1AA2
MFEVFKNLQFFSNQKIKEVLVSDFISEPNKHIEEYLDCYRKDKGLEYGVFINGEWGIGKTWFVKSYIKNKKNIAYVSLNGISKKEEIDQAIFCFLHPILGSKPARLIGKIASGALKTSLNIDLNNDGNKDGSVTLSAPTINIPDFLKVDEGFLLIFDDLERCKIPVEEVLGYINFFIEHQKIKVLIVGNEEEIEEGATYNKIREKLIGASFNYIEDSSVAINLFIDEIFEGEVKDILKNNKETIELIFNASEFKNLRSLKQILSNFNRLSKLIYRKDSEDVFLKIMQLFLIFSIEYKNGTFAGEILKFKLDDSSEKKDSKTLLKFKREDEFYKKYSFVNMRQTILELDVWSEIIIKNLINVSVVKNNIEKNYLSIKKDDPDWYKLWFFENYENEECQRIIDNYKNLIKAGLVEHVGEIKHVIGLLIYFEENGVIQIDIGEYINYALENIRKIPFGFDKNTDKISNINGKISRTSWSGYRFYCHENHLFVGFLENCQIIFNEKKVEIIKIKAKELLNILSLDSYEFCQKIKSSEDYAHLSILKYIEPKEFAKELIKIDVESKMHVMETLTNRYPEGSELLKEEGEWILSVQNEIEEIYNSSTSFKKFAIKKNFIERFNILRDLYTHL